VRNNAQILASVQKYCAGIIYAGNSLTLGFQSYFQSSVILEYSIKFQNIINALRFTEATFEERKVNNTVRESVIVLKWVYVLTLWMI